MTHTYRGLAVAVATATVVASIGSIYPAQAFQFYYDRDQWEAALSGSSTTTYDFGSTTTLTSGTTTTFSNGVSATVSFNGNGSVSDSGFSFGATQGSVRPTLNVNLSSGVNALGFDISVGPVNRNYFSQFFTETGRVGFNSSAYTFYGIIADPGDSLITGFTLSSNSAGTGYVRVSNITSSTFSIPEPSSLLGLLAVSTLGASSVLLRKNKQRKLTIV